MHPMLKATPPAVVVPFPQAVEATPKAIHYCPKCPHVISAMRQSTADPAFAEHYVTVHRQSEGDAA